LRTARKTLSSISAQDEFAKWARQQRQVDKLQQQFDKINGERQRNLLAKTVGLGLALRVMLYGCTFWLTSYKMMGVGMFCLRDGLFGPLSFILSLPKAPSGILANCIHLVIYSVGCISAPVLFTLSSLVANRLISIIYTK